MPSIIHVIENLRYEILEKCQEEQVSEYRVAVSKAIETIPNFFKLSHPKAFRNECCGIELLNTLHFDNEQHKSENINATVKYWAESMDTLMDYIVTTATEKSINACMTSIVATWEAFIIDIALLHLGPIATPQEIKSENAEEAFSSIPRNYCLLRNSNWPELKVPLLEKEVWRYAWCKRRKVHRRLVITRLQYLLRNLRETFGWEITRRLIYRRKQMVFSMRNVANRVLPPPPLLQQSLLTIDHVQRETFRQEFPTLHSKNPVNETNCKWPTHVAIGAELHLKRCPTLTYIVLAIKPTKLVLQRKSVVSAQHTLGIVEVSFASEIADPKIIAHHRPLMERKRARPFEESKTKDQATKQRILGKRSRSEKPYYETKNGKNSNSNPEHMVKKSMPEVIESRRALSDASLKPRQNPIVFSTRSGRDTHKPRKRAKNQSRSAGQVKVRRSDRLSQKKPRFGEAIMLDLPPKAKIMRTNSLALHHINSSLWDPNSIRSPSKPRKIGPSNLIKRAALGISPPRKQPRSSETKVNPRRGVKVRKKDKICGAWSSSEEKALRDGLRVFPLQPVTILNKGRRGCWSKIKEDKRWRGALSGRTTTQMKDKARSWILVGYLKKVPHKWKNVRRK